jgi:hypothetical protein
MNQTWPPLRLRPSAAKLPTTLVHKVSRFSVGAILGVSLALPIATAKAPHASAQAVAYAGTGGVNFGTANVCASGNATPAPCSQTLTLTYNVTASGILGTPRALTTGAPNLDYELASGSTCIGSAVQGNTCTVNVTFAPIAPGARNGAVEIVDGTGNVLATTYIYGSAVGPMIAFSPPTQRILYAPGADIYLSEVAVDASGNVFASETGDIVELLAVGGSVPAGPAVRSIGSGIYSPEVTSAIDGAGNLFNYDGLQQTVFEIPAAGGYATVNAVGGSIQEAGGLAIDGSANLFVAELFPPGVTEFFAASGYTTSKALGGTFAFDYPSSVAVDGSGNVFVADFSIPDGSYKGAIEEIPAAGGYATVRTIHVSSAAHQGPGEVAVDPAGNLFVQFAGSPSTFLGEALAVDGVVASNPTVVNIAPNTAYLETFALDGRGNILYTTFVGDPRSGVEELAELQFSTPPPLNFDSTVVGYASADSPQSVQIQNKGNANLATTAVSVSANWDLVAGSGTPADCTASFSLIPTAQCNLSISFQPTEAGTLTGAVTLVDNSLNAPGSMQLVPLSGVGISNPAPYVASLNSTYGSPYSVVILSGYNFGAVQGSSTVTFNGIATPHYYWSNTKIYVTVPPKATTGNIVVAVDGKSSNPSAFTVLPQPVVTGIFPTSGPVGSFVTISGTNLLDYGNKAKVTFNGHSLTILGQTSTFLTVAIPTGAFSGDFHVLVNDTGINTSTFTVTP